MEKNFKLKSHIQIINLSISSASFAIFTTSLGNHGDETIVCCEEIKQWVVSICLIAPFEASQVHRRCHRPLLMKDHYRHLFTTVFRISSVEQEGLDIIERLGSELWMHASSIIHGLLLLKSLGSVTSRRSDTWLMTWLLIQEGALQTRGVFFRRCLGRRWCSC